jgi:hypothetical protein
VCTVLCFCGFRETASSFLGSEVSANRSKVGNSRWNNIPTISVNHILYCYYEYLGYFIAVPAVMRTSFYLLMRKQIVLHGGLVFLFLDFSRDIFCADNCTVASHTTYSEHCCTFRSSVTWDFRVARLLILTCVYYSSDLPVFLRNLQLYSVLTCAPL